MRGIVPVHGGREVETAGDSFLLEFSSALSAVHAIIEIQRQLAAENSQPGAAQVVLRASVHLGDVEHRGREVYGDGVNISARLLPLSPPGGMALSAPVLAMVRQRIELPARSIGTPELKNISSPVEIFVVEADRLGSIATPAALSEPTRAPAPARMRRAAWVAAAVLVASSGAWLLLKNAHLGTGALDKSVAVLPFSNLSGQKDNEYFADGMQDAIITQLAHVKDLKVISRTSVMEYKDKARNLKEIGRQLGVANIVEGGVQKIGGRVRVSAQLINVDNDHHLWAESYDRDIADVFAIQSEVAQEVVAAVSATLTPAEKAQLEQAPTANTDAYDAYLRARELFWGQATAESLEPIQRYLDRAVELDPGFALAHALLSLNDITQYWYGVDPSAHRRDRALREAETALRLRPDLAEGHVAKGVYWYQGFLDFERAQSEFDLALRFQPNFAEAHAFKGFAHRRQGRIDETLAELGRAGELDPRNMVYLIELGQTEELAGRYAQADAAYGRAFELNPLPEVAIQRALGRVRWHGDPAPLREVLAALPREADPDSLATSARVRLAEWEGRFNDAAKLLQSLAPDTFASEGAGRIPKALLLGREYAFMSSAGRARPYFEQARDGLGPQIQQAGDSNLAWGDHVSLALALAYLGDRVSAAREAKLAESLNQNPGDPMLRAEFQLRLAEVYLLVGDKAHALALLKEALARPSSINANDVRLAPAFRTLRDNPQFQQLLAGAPHDR